MTSAGDISLRMLLDTSGFAAGMNTSISMLSVFQRAQTAAFAPNGPKINTAQFKAEIDGLNAANQSFQNSLKQTTAAEQQNTAAVNTETTALNQNTNAVRSNEGETQRLKSAWQSFAQVGANVSLMSQGLYQGTTALFNFGKESVSGAVKMEVLKKGFQGTEADLERFRIATGRTVGTGSLIQLSNQASDLGLNMANQSLAFFLAKEAAERYGIGVEEGFQRVVYASEGSTRGLRTIGVQQAIYKAILADLVKAKGGELEVTQGLNNEQSITIKNLDPLTQKELQFEAIIKAKGITLNDVNNRLQTNADKVEQLDLLVPQVKKQFGEWIAGGFIPLIENLKTTEGKFNNTTVAITGIGYAIVAVLPLAAQLKIAFGTAGLAAAGMAGFIVAAGAAMAKLEDLINNYVPFSFGQTSAPGLMYQNYFDKQTQNFLDSQNNNQDVGNEIIQRELQKAYKKAEQDKLMQSLQGKQVKPPKEKKSKEEYVYTTDIEDAYAKIEEIKKSQEKAPVGSMQFQIYDEQIQKLIDKINYLKALSSDILSSGNLQPGKVNKGFLDPFTGNVIPLPKGNENTPIAFNRSGSETPMSHLLKTAKEKEPEATAKEWMSNAQQFSGALTSLSSTVGIVDTGFGQMAKGIDTFLSGISQFMQLINSFGGSSGLISGLFGLGASIFSGGTATAAGFLSGGGGGGFGRMGNSIGRGFQGNVNNITGNRPHVIRETVYLESVTRGTDLVHIVNKVNTQIKNEKT